VLFLIGPLAGAGALPRVVVLSAPYKGSLASPGYSLSVNGCASAKVTALPQWNASTGDLRTSDAARAKACQKAFGSAAADSFGQAGSAVDLGVPFRVASNGSHSISSSWTFTTAATRTATIGGCPPKRVNFHPGLYSSTTGQCSDGTTLYLYISSRVVDLNNASWYQYNGSGVQMYNESGWLNYTDCYNYGTPTCYNTTGPFSYAFSSFLNTQGFSASAWSGSVGATFWTNGTSMRAGHHYALLVTVSFFVEAFAIAYGLTTPWVASASASLNMATLGNAARLNSISIS
jgi:hypothetical protein